MLNKTLIERMMNTLNQCIPDSLKDCKSEINKQFHEVIIKVLSDFHIVTQDEFQAHLTLLKNLETQIQDLEIRVKKMEKKISGGPKKTTSST